MRRVLLAFSRFGPRVQKVSVRLRELPNPLGGADQQCRMRAHVPGAGSIRMETINGELELAVAKAAALLAQRVDLALRGTGDGRTTPLPGQQDQHAPGRRRQMRSK